MLGAEGGERAEGVGDAQQGGGVVADFEVRGTLRDELGAELVCVLFCEVWMGGGFVVVFYMRCDGADVRRRDLRREAL